ncbi:MAG: patatin-like phospholipase family protein [Acidobacteriaceae bacterium]
MNITLALGGGGVKGFAHIGVIRVLEGEGYRIRAIAGSSAGGMVGALYAAGYSPDAMEKYVREIDLGGLFARMHGDGPSLLGFSGVTAILSDLLGERTFSDLRLPLVVTATDLTSGMPVVIKQGRLLEAVLATSAAPGVFPAHLQAGQLLVDGGVMNPIPVSEARALFPAAPVVAVILSPPLGWQPGIQDGSAQAIPVLMTNLPLVYRLAGRLRLTQAFNLFVRAMDLSGQMLLEKQVGLERPEVIIRPILSHIGIVDRVNIPELIKNGETAARNALPEIHKAFTWHARLWRNLSRRLSPNPGDSDDS